MAGNAFLSPTVIAKEILRILHNNITFTKGVNRQYDSSFANSGITVSGKVGPSLRVRKPNRFTVTDGAALVVQDLTEDYVTVSMTTQKHVAMKFTSQDLTLTIDDFSERYIKPAALALASKLDQDGCNLYKTVYNSVGTPGVTPQSALVYLQARAKLDNYTCPRDDMRTACINPIAEAYTVDSLKTLFHLGSAVGSQYDAGEMGHAFGLNFKMDQNLASHIAGDATGALVNSSSQTGATLSIKSINGGTGSQVVKSGDMFTIPGVYQVNPETKATTNDLQQFVVTADSTASSGSIAALPISPSIVITGATQTVNAAPVGDVHIDFNMGATPGVSYPQNMIMHRDAFTCVSADLIMPDGVDFKAREVNDGISVRIIRQYNINGDELPTRVDLIYGWQTLYPFFAARLWG